MDEIQEAYEVIKDKLNFLESKGEDIRLGSGTIDGSKTFIGARIAGRFGLIISVPGEEKWEVWPS